MSEWKRYKLGELLSIKHGWAFKSENYVKDGKTALVTLRNISEDSRFVFDVNKTTYYGGEYPEEYNLNEGDLIIPLTEQVVGLLGNSAFVPNFSDIKFVLNQRVGKVQEKYEKIDKIFLKYLLSTTTVRTQMEYRASGTKQRNISPKDIYDIEVYIPELVIQKYIGRILYNLDKKIQINNQINQELEAMAKTLYDYWFVQFDFPDQNGKPYKSSGGKMVYNPELKREIPEGWGVEKLSSLLEIGRETINPMKTPKEEFKYYSIPEYDVSGSFSYELGETIRSNKFIVEKSDLLVSKLNPWFNRVVYNLEENAISSTEFIVWKTFNRFEKNFLYQVATSKEFIEYCTRFATGTSNSHKRVSPDIMVGFQIPFKKTYIQKFGEITDSIRTQVLQNNVQNQELTQLRDWLLPMLMNGQVKVE